MNPRLKTSKKWTSFPAEYQSQILQAFEDNYRDQLLEGKFLIEGRIYPEEILFRVGFLQKGRLFQANFEASVQYLGMDNAQSSINFCIDSTGSMLEQYYQSQQLMDMPLDWKEFEIDEKKVFLKFSTVNTDLEAEADKILGLYESSLIREEFLDPEIETETEQDQNPIMNSEAASHNSSDLM